MDKKESEMLIEMFKERLNDLDNKMEAIRATVAKLQLWLAIAIATLGGTGAVNVVEFFNK